MFTGLTAEDCRQIHSLIPGFTAEKLEIPGKIIIIAAFEQNLKFCFVRNIKPFCKSLQIHLVTWC